MANCTFSNRTITVHLQNPNYGGSQQIVVIVELCFESVNSCEKKVWNEKIKHGISEDSPDWELLLNASKQTKDLSCFSLDLLRNYLTKEKERDPGVHESWSPALTTKMELEPEIKPPYYSSLFSRGEWKYLLILQSFVDIHLLQPILISWIHNALQRN